MLDAIGYIQVHAWPPIGPAEGAKQLVPSTVPQGVVCVHQQLYMSHKWWNIHPMLGQGGCSWEKDLQFSAAQLTHLPQLPESVGLIYILG